MLEFIIVAVLAIWFLLALRYLLRNPGCGCGGRYHSCTGCKTGCSGCKSQTCKKAGNKHETGK